MYELVIQILEEERIPEEWKETIIVPIHKRGGRDRCENYRGLALGNAAYKILSNIILGKIKPFIEKVMGDYQNAFRDGISVTDNTFALEIINEKLWEYNQSVQYRVIQKSIRNFRTRPRNNQDRHGRKEHINRYRISQSFFFVLGALAYLQVPPLGGNHDEKWRAQ